MYTKAFLNGEVYVNNEFVKTNLYIQGEKIAKISDEHYKASEIIDATGLRIIPGLIDAHVHLNMQGGSSCSSDDYETGTWAAAYGGVTTIIDFLSEASYAAEIEKMFQSKMLETKDACIDYAFHASIRELVDSPDEIAEAALKLDMPTIKLYTTYRVYSSPKTIEGMIKRSSRGDIMIMCHCEQDDLLNKKESAIDQHGNNRPPISEITSVRQIAIWTRKHKGKTYIVHTSCGSTIEMLKQDFDDILGKNLFIEGAPHYFLFDDSVYSTSNARLYTMTPPLRPSSEREKLISNWQEVNCFATDHCPFMKKDKLKHSIQDIDMGVGGVEHAFSVLHPLFGDAIIDRFTEQPARLHGLYPRKGVIAVGSDADLLVYQETALKPIRDNHSQSDYSIYENTCKDISVVSVLSRGNYVIREGIAMPHTGVYLARKIV